MANTITGRIWKISDVQEIPTRSGVALRKREVVLDASRFDPYTGDKYENFPSVEFVGKHCDDVAGFAVGELVTLSFFLSGRRAEREGVERYFTSIQGVGLERKVVAQQQTAVQPHSQPVQPQPAQTQEVSASGVVYQPQAPEGAVINYENLPF